jgi:hypothetical protein
LKRAAVSGSSSGPGTPVRRSWPRSLESGMS